MKQISLKSRDKKIVQNPFYNWYRNDEEEELSETTEDDVVVTPSIPPPVIASPEPSDLDANRFHVFHALDQNDPETAKSISKAATSALSLLDGWAAILLIRISKEDLGDYIEDIHNRAEKGQSWKLWIRTITALIWTTINAAGYLMQTLFKNPGYQASDKKNK